MKNSTYQWIEKNEVIHPEIIQWLEKNKLPAELAGLLNKRHINTGEELDSYFFPTIEHFHSPFLLADMEKAITRLQEAIELGQKIVIYGDYDADGITSTTVMKEAIELVGGQVEVYLPNRFTDGYGPNVDVYKELITNGAELIVTVDNGVTGHEAVEYAKTQHVDVIITDHHELPDTLPDALAVIHPKHPKGDYPFGDLAGVGVAFKVATALLDEVPLELLDLVAIGTVADLVSLTDENRAMVKIGLEQMKHSERIGLSSLCDVAGISLSDITAENIGFGIAPRLNAIGRLGDATPGVQLLSTFDQEEAEILAKKIQETNEERQTIVKKISQEALEMVSEIGERNCYVLAKEGWHEGVLGIVASQVVQKTNRPAIVLSIDSKTGLAKGSGRSIEAINLYDVLQLVADDLVKFGGHHMAAGMTLQATSLSIVQEKIDKIIHSLGIDFNLGRPLEVEKDFDLSDVSVKFIESLSLVGPFGTGNPAPILAFEKGMATKVKQIGADRSHLKFTFNAADSDLDVIGFGFGNSSLDVETASDLAIAGELSVNEWNGNKKPQLMLKDFKISGKQVIDYREKLTKLSELKHLSNAWFVLFDEANRKHFKEVEDHIILSKDLLTHPKERVTDTIVFLDCPTDEAEVSEVLASYPVNNVYLIFYSEDRCYLNGMPSREQFGKLFKLVQVEPEIDIRFKLNDLANYLKVDKNSIIFMINVFFDLKFVTIVGGVMKKVENLQFTPLTESGVYQKRERKAQSEKILLYSNLKEIENWLFQ